MPNFVFGTEADLVRNLGQRLYDLPLAGFKYAVTPGDELWERTQATFGLERLQHINQFGCTTTPVRLGLTARGTKSGVVFPHVRYTHVHDVAAVAYRIALQNKLDAYRTNVLLIAALSHDTLTPAGGDTTKEVDEVAFDEDANYPVLFKRPGWESLRERYKLNETELAAIIRNEGMLGELLDWADKIGYMARDTYEYLLAMDRPDLDEDGYYTEIRDLVASNPGICHIWKTLRIVDGRVASDDPDALARFLRLRVLMFREIHYGDRSRFLRVVIHSALQLMLARKELTVEQLLTIDDDKLHNIILERTGASISSFASDPMGEPALLRLADEQAVKSQMQLLYGEGVYLTGSIDRYKWVKPRADLPVIVDGRVQPFESVRPKEAAALMSLAREGPPILFYWLAGSKLKDSFLKDLMNLRRCEIYGVSPPR